MNERIKELALLSGFDIDTNVSFAEKTRLDCFAKLIVAECLVTLDSITSGDRDTLWVARKVIADHFGVE